MNCVVCKENSTNSRSIEHIVPESLGNKNHILPRGIVCDNCNSYFARKVEKKALETEFFTSLRHRNSIESKKGRIPNGTAIVPNTLSKADIIFRKNTPIEVVLDRKSFELVTEGKVNHLIIPWTIDVPKNDQNISRFLAKIGYEMMVSALLGKPDFLQELVNDQQLNPLREYIRFNSKNQNWAYNVRQIYKEDENFFKDDGETVDMVFESTFLATELSELYFIVAFKGFEFVINMAGDSIEGFEKWLTDNNDVSPLYTDDKSFGSKLTPEFLKK